MSFLEGILAVAAAAKSLQSCPTLWDPIDGSPPGSPVPGILQARTLEWVAISLSNAWKWKVKVKSLGLVRLLVTAWAAAYQAPPSMGFSRREYWSGVPLPSPILAVEQSNSLQMCYVNFTIWTEQKREGKGHPFKKWGGKRCFSVGMCSQINRVFREGQVNVVAVSLVGHVWLYPMDCRPPDSSVHATLQARILEWVAISSSRGSSTPRDWTLVSCIVGRFFTVWATRIPSSSNECRLFTTAPSEAGFQICRDEIMPSIFLA